MLIASIVLFALAAIIGFILILKVFNNSPRPLILILAQGLFAALGLFLLLIYSVSNSDKLSLTNVTIFVLAAFGGFMMFGIDMSKEQIPRIVVIIHAGAAVIGHFILISFVSVF